MPRKKVKGEKVRYLLPEYTIQLIDDILNDTEEHKVKSIWRQKYYHVLDYVVNLTLAHENEKLSVDYVNIHTQTMADILSVSKHQMSRMMKHLRSYGILKCDNKFKQAPFRWDRNGRTYVGPGKSYGYTTTQQDTLKLVEIEDNRKQYIKRQQTKAGKSIIKEKELRLYHDVLNCLEIDDGQWEKAVEKILSKKEEKKKREIMYNEYIDRISLKPTLHDNIDNSIALGCIIVPDIEDDKTTLARCEMSRFKIEHKFLVPSRLNGRRVYSPITNLYRELRKCLRLDGNELIGIDIRNSQPLIASIPIREYWLQKEGFIPEDVHEYQRNCEAGTFYDYFMSELNIPDELRLEFKIDFFRKVYFSMELRKHNPLKTMFNEKYPNVALAIFDIKGSEFFSRTYGEFARMLQQEESQIIFDEVNIPLINAGISAINIFDAIYVADEKHLETAVKLLREAFKKRGLSPTLNYE